MRALVLEKIGQPLQIKEINNPTPKEQEILIQVSACALCRTDLHIIAGELVPPKFPLILGHQIVGYVAELGSHVTQFSIGDRVGVPWLGYSCGKCQYCKKEKENLCDEALFTGFHLQGGLAEYCTADARFVFSLPKIYDDCRIAPLLCAGMIGYRSMKMADNAQSIGFYGFGAAAHLLIQIATYQNRKVYVFTKKGDRVGQAKALEHGATWAGDSETVSPHLLEAAIIFAPVGNLVPQALRSLQKGGEVICAGIHMSDIPSFPYKTLWGERVIRSVANLTRRDGQELLAIAPKIPIRPEITIYPLERTNEALQDLQKGEIAGSAVIEIASTEPN